VLVLCPTLFIAAVAHFVIQSGKAKAKQELARLVPVEDRKEDSLEKRMLNLNAVHIDPQSEGGGGEEEEEKDPDQFNGLHISRQLPNNTKFRTRRESLQIGRNLLSEIRELRTLTSIRDGLNTNLDSEDSSIEEGVSNESSESYSDEDYYNAGRQGKWVAESRVIRNVGSQSSISEDVSVDAIESGTSGQEDIITGRVVGSVRRAAGVGIGTAGAGRAGLRPYWKERGLEDEEELAENVREVEDTSL
jgi:hypothetical protein